MLSEIDASLVGILALTDAVFAPQRDYDGDRGSNTYAARQTYTVGGVRWAGGSTATAAGQHANQLLRRVADTGLLTVRRGGKGRARLVRLTDAGDAHARRLVGLPSLRAAWDLLERVAGRTKRRSAPRFLTDSWISELLLCGLRNYPRPGSAQEADVKAQLVRVEEAMLPALARGWADSRATLRRAVYYSILPTGWEALATAQAPTAEPEAEADEEARSLYYGSIRDAIEALGTGEPEDAREIGYIPLPCAMAGDE